MQRCPLSGHLFVIDETPFRFPWEPAVPSTADTVAMMQRDLTYMVSHTAVLVRSNRPELAMLVNTPRGQIVPRGQSTFTDGVTMEMQDIGMPQVGAPEMTIHELGAHLWGVVSSLGLELVV